MGFGVVMVGFGLEGFGFRLLVWGLWWRLDFWGLGLGCMLEFTDDGGDGGGVWSVDWSGGWSGGWSVWCLGVGRVYGCYGWIRGIRWWCGFGNTQNTKHIFNKTLQ